MPSPGEILTKVNNLPTLPSAVNRLSSLMKDNRASAADFESVIKPDPALTANLLRLANSAFFGFLTEIASVKQAVTLMGFKRVFELALSGAFSQVIPNKLEGYDIPATVFWSHSLATAVMAEKLSQHLHLKVPDMIFTAGLLHDIGKVALASYFASHTKISSLTTHSKLPHFQSERLALETDHSETGALLAQLWNLPTGVEAAIRWHHQPSEAPSPDNLVDLVHVADALAHLTHHSTDLVPVEHPIDPQALDRLGFKPDRIDPFLQTIAPIVNQVILQMTKQK